MFYCKGTAVPLQAWSGPEGFRKLGFPDYMTKAPAAFTYLLTPCCRVLLEKLTGFQLVTKFPAFYGT